MKKTISLLSLLLAVGLLTTGCTPSDSNDNSSVTGSGNPTSSPVVLTELGKLQLVLRDYFAQDAIHFAAQENNYVGEAETPEYSYDYIMQYKKTATDVNAVITELESEEYDGYTAYYHNGMIYELYNEYWYKDIGTFSSFRLENPAWVFGEAISDHMLEINAKEGNVYEIEVDIKQCYYDIMLNNPFLMLGGSPLMPKYIIDSMQALLLESGDLEETIEMIFGGNLIVEVENNQLKNMTINVILGDEDDFERHELVYEIKSNQNLVVEIPPQEALDQAVEVNDLFGALSVYSFVATTPSDEQLVYDSYVTVSMTDGISQKAKLSNDAATIYFLLDNYHFAYYSDSNQEDLAVLLSTMENTLNDELLYELIYSENLVYTQDWNNNKLVLTYKDSGIGEVKIHLVYDGAFIVIDKYEGKNVGASKATVIQTTESHDFIIPAGLPPIDLFQ